MRSLAVALLVAASTLGALLGMPILGGALADGPHAALAQQGYSGKLVVGRFDGIWIVPLDGAPPSQLVAVDNNASITGVSWSPWGDRVAYTRFSFGAGSTVGGADLHVVDLGGADTILAARDDANTLLGTPSWAPDGGSIVFDVTQVDTSSVANTRRRIDRVAADGTWRIVELQDAYQPNLSRNNRTMAFARLEPTGVSIHTRDLVTGVETVAVPAGVVSGPWPPSLSPDGATVVFGASGGPGLLATSVRCANWPTAGLFDPPIASAHGLPEELWRVGADGSGLTRITNLCIDDPIVAWSPDGAWMAEFGATSLTLLNALGGPSIPIWNDGGYGGVDWAP